VKRPVAPPRGHEERSHLPADDVADQGRAEARGKAGEGVGLARLWTGPVGRRLVRLCGVCQRPHRPAGLGPSPAPLIPPRSIASSHATLDCVEAIDCALGRVVPLPVHVTPRRHTVNTMEPG